MLRAVAVSVLDPAPVWGNRRESQLLQIRPPLPKQPATPRQRMIWEGHAPSSAVEEDTRMCSHWPSGGLAQIQTAAGWFRVMAEGLALDGPYETPAAQQARCLDLENLLSAPTGDASMQRLAALWAEVQMQKLALGALADDFVTISDWLTNAAGLSWDAAKAMRQQPGLAVAIGESQRLVSKDSLLADGNALIAAMLRRAVKMLDRLDPATGSVNTDMAGRRAYAHILSQIADLLDNAANLGSEATGFVEEFDRRWRQMRRQVAQAVALTTKPASSPE